MTAAAFIAASRRSGDKYVVSHPAVTVAIPGTRRVTHVEDNNGAARGRLDDAALRRRMEQHWDSMPA